MTEELSEGMHQEEKELEAIEQTCMRLFCVIRSINTATFHFYVSFVSTCMERPFSEQIGIAGVTVFFASLFATKSLGTAVFITGSHALAHYFAAQSSSATVPVIGNQNNSNCYRPLPGSKSSCLDYA